MLFGICRLYLLGRLIFSVNPSNRSLACLLHSSTNTSSLFCHEKNHCENHIQEHTTHFLNSFFRLSLIITHPYSKCADVPIFFEQSKTIFFTLKQLMNNNWRMNINVCISETFHVNVKVLTWLSIIIGKCWVMNREKISLQRETNPVTFPLILLNSLSNEA